MPFLAPIPFPTIIATGVASPRAQGQLMTRTAIACIIALSASAPLMSQIIRVIIEVNITRGTKIPETLSAILAMGALLAAASLTSCII